MLPSEQHAQHQRRERIWGNQSGHFGLQESVVAAITNDEQQFRYRQLHKNDAEHKKEARTLRKTLWLINPKLCNRGGQNQQSNYKILRRLWLLAAKDEQCEATRKNRENYYLRVGRIFQ